MEDCQQTDTLNDYDKVNVVPLVKPATHAQGLYCPIIVAGFPTRPLIFFERVISSSSSSSYPLTPAAQTLEYEVGEDRVITGLKSWHSNKCVLSLFGAYSEQLCARCPPQASC